MKKIIAIVLMFAAAACSGTKTIPDEQLAAIFREIYLANAWCVRNGVDCDSLDVYEPVFAAHGYTAEDFVNTLSNFSRRKSSRLSDVVNKAIEMLEKEEKDYENRVAVLNFIDSLALARAADTVFTADLIRVGRIKDTARLRIELPAGEGSYDVSYRYVIDSADGNRRVQARFEVLDSAGGCLSSSSGWLRRADTARYTTRIETGPQAARIVLRPALYPDDLARPSLRIDSLTVTAYPPLADALERLYRRHVNYQLLINGKRFDAPADSGSLYILPPAAFTPPDSVGGAGRDDS